MKKKLIKTMLITLTAIFLIGISLKLYFEIEAYRIPINKDPKFIINTPIEHKQVEEKDYSIHYYTSGYKDSTAILLLHPALSDHTAFDRQIDDLSEKHYVISIDLLGHGLSGNKNTSDQIYTTFMHINKILDQEGISQIHIVGVSLGALLAQHYAYIHPEKTLSLTSCGGYNIHRDNKKIVQAQWKHNIGFILRAFISPHAFKVKTSDISCSTSIGKSLFHNSMKHFTTNSFKAMSGLGQVIKERDVNSYSFPVQIITGEYDLALAKTVSDKWASECNIKEVHLIKNAGHCVQLDNPEEFNKLLIHFIDENLFEKN